MRLPLLLAEGVLGRLAGERERRGPGGVDGDAFARSTLGTGHFALRVWGARKRRIFAGVHPAAGAVSEATFPYSDYQ